MCEIYICDLCEIGMKSLSNMKTYIGKEPGREKKLAHTSKNEQKQP